VRAGVRSWLRRGGLAGVGIFAALQLVRPTLRNSDVRAEASMAPEIAQTLESSCYDCHSNQTNLRWFDEIVPGYWLVVKDVNDGRARLNFSELGLLPPPAQRAALYEALNQVRLGAMPPSQYLLLHPDARVSAAQGKAWENALALPAGAVAGPVEVTVASPRPRGTVAAAPNGIAFPDDFVDWVPVSMTNRFDNHTVRLVLGNPVALRAIAQGQIRPWPDGASFVKAAWSAGNEGARLVQIELMTKDARAHASTEGWGFARWRGEALVPYGKDASFVEECTGCHAPVKNHDFVYTMPIGRGDGSDAWNAEAALPAGLSVDPSGWRAIGASFVGNDGAGGSMTTKFGNDAAVAHARGSDTGAYPAGAILARVTWSEQADREWFGARIPGAPRSIEIVRFSAGDGGKVEPAYESFDGTSAARTTPADASVVGPLIQAIVGAPLAR
jgi:hypothetical protein